MNLNFLTICLALSTDDNKYLFGIISYGNGCASTYPGIYTRVDKYLDWIEKEMTALG
jgi:secreted trypsin-like serine protease